MAGGWWLAYRRMRRTRRVGRLLFRVIFIACMAAMLGHSSTGHAHADLLAPAPAHEHVPGDEHHEAAGGSCEALRAPAPDGTPVILVEDAIGAVSFIAASTATPVYIRPVLVQPPLFLLHAALLI